MELKAAAVDFFILSFYFEGSNDIKDSPIVTSPLISLSTHTTAPAAILALQENTHRHTQIYRDHHSNKRGLHDSENKQHIDHRLAAAVSASAIHGEYD